MSPCASLRAPAGRCAEVGAELALQFEQQPLGGLLADARHLDQARAVLPAHGRAEFGHAQARQDGQRRARSDAADLHQFAEGRALGGGEKAVQQLRVLAHHEMREQRHRHAQGGQVVEGAHRHVDLVADAVHVEHHRGRRLVDQRAAEPADHAAAGARKVRRLQRGSPTWRRRWRRCGQVHRAACGRVGRMRQARHGRCTAGVTRRPGRRRRSSRRARARNSAAAGRRFDDRRRARRRPPGRCPG